jgi:HEAT repeat protein
MIRLLALAALFGMAAGAQTESQLNTNERILRIREMAKRNAAAAIPALTPYLTDPDRDIRVEVVKAFVKLDTERSLDPLVQATRDSDGEVQIRATDGLVNYYIPGYVAKSGLTGSLTRGVRQVKSFFASRNDQVVDPDVVVRPDVAQALSDEVKRDTSTDARANAALASGILRNRVAVESLESSLHSRNSELIFECLVALQKIGDVSAGPGVSFLAHDLDPRIQITALQTIGLLRSLTSAPDVRSALKDARTIKVRRAALDSLAMLGLGEDRPVFLQYLNDRDAELRSAGLEGLGRIREPEDTPALQAAFDEPDADWRVHMAAAFALVSEGKVDTSEFSPLPYLFENVKANDRSKVASAYLTELARREDVRRTLVSMLPSATKEQKLAMCSMLGDGRDPDAIPVLQKLSNDVDPDVALAASRSLRIAQTRRAQ